MCGIAGIINKGEINSGIDSIREAFSLLERRGPDGDGIFECELDAWSVLLGHKRLKIIDLHDRASQPFHYNHLTIVFNGEIYNYIELREELIKLGYEFKTDSDTEVFLIAFDCWGKSAVSRFDGMFAAVVLDTKQKKLYLMRDRFGEKPLYFTKSKDRIAFASTLNAILQLRENTIAKFNIDYAELFLSLGYSPSSFTAIEGVEKINAGGIHEFDLATEEWIVECEPAFDAFVANHASESFNIEKFENILLDSLERRLRADVPLALLLSGGIDSGYLAVLISKHLGRNINAITIHDRSDSTEELDRARKLCDILGIDHKIVPMPEQPLHELMDRAMPAMDEPIGDPAFPMLCRLFENIPEDIRVVITGDGADELFLSYGNYKKILKQNQSVILKIMGLIFRATAKEISRMPVPIRRIALRLISTSNQDSTERFRQLSGVAGWWGIIEEIYKEPLLSKNAADTLGLYEYSFKYELPEYLLVKADRASMYNSRESRAPFLNSELTSYISSCDPNSICVGTKKHIVDRLNKLIGTDLSFEKRGFFASGQNCLKRSAIEWNAHLRNSRFANVIRKAQDPFWVDSSKYYRLLILNNWLNANQNNISNSGEQI